MSVADFAVVGQQAEARAELDRQGTVDLPGLVLGDGCSIGSHTVLMAGTTLGAGLIVGDNAGVRERCRIGEDVVVGRSRHRRERHDHRRPRRRSSPARTSPRTCVIEDDVLHRADGRHHERQLHGPHRGALQAPQGLHHPPRRARRRRRAHPAGHRDRRGGVRRHRLGRHARRAAAHARDGRAGEARARRSPTRSCSRTSDVAGDARRVAPTVERTEGANAMGDPPARPQGAVPRAQGRARRRVVES